MHGEFRVLDNYVVTPPEMLLPTLGVILSNSLVMSR